LHLQITDPSNLIHSSEFIYQAQTGTSFLDFNR